PQNLGALKGVPNYQFQQIDIRDAQAIKVAFEEFQPDWVVHFAAESHVDRSIVSPDDFISTNVLGTLNLLLAARDVWRGDQEKLFHHVSTDEVYGSLGKEGKFTEETPYDPSSPYSASKASSDHLVRAFARTYD